MQQQLEIAVMIVSDHPIMRDGLRLCIQRETDMWVVCEASDLTQTLREFWICRPHVVVIDLSQPRGAGLHAMDAIRNLSPEMPLVIFVSELDEFSGSTGIQGATVIVSRTRASQEIIPAIRKLIAQP
jgi:DNA-binding NarL/FixJ family response regulator